jgi:signal transduction histidine kinase
MRALERSPPPLHTKTLPIPVAKGRIVWVWFTLAGMVVGYLLVHPFAMLAYSLGPRLPHLPMDFPFWGHHIRTSFGAEMMVMGGAFAFLGGVAGLCLGMWYVQKERWIAENLESQRRLAALETLGELMVTLAHHIRNANVVIGGFSARILKNTEDPEMQRQLKLIQKASLEIEAVIASLESLSQIDHVRYIGEWETRMIDLNQELKARLVAAEAARKSNER